MTRLLYVSPHFPKTRHGFQATEIEEISRRVPVSVVSLRRATADEWSWLSRGFTSLDASTAEPLSVRDGWVGLRLAVRHPLRLVRLLTELLGAARSDFRGIAKTILSAVLGIFVAGRASRMRATWIHADFCASSATAALVGARILGLGWSMNGRAFDIFSTLPAGRATNRLLALKMHLVDVAFAESEAAMRRMKTVGVAHGIVANPVLKRNGVRIPSTVVPKQRGDAFVVASFGALVEKKGLDVLIRAAAEARIPSLRLELHGGGPERPALEQLAASLGVSVEFAGAYAHDELAARLSRADVVAVASRRTSTGDSDGVPTVLIEALAHGVPVVGTDVGGVSELVIDQATGLLVEPQNVRALAVALGLLAQDESLRARLANAGGELVRREFSVERTATTFIDAVFPDQTAVAACVSSM